MNDQAPARAALPPLLLVTDRRRAGGEVPLLERVSLAVEGGVRFIQLREKDLDGEGIVSLAVRLVKAIAQRCGDAAARETLLVVNGNVEAARRVGAGLHLSAADARAFRDGTGAGGPLSLGLLPRPLGASAHQGEETADALHLGVDYIVAGTVYATPSKPGRRLLGTGGLRALVTAAGDVPVYAIGGLTAARVEDVAGAGAYGAAVCGGILVARDPAAAARAFLRALRRCARVPPKAPPAWRSTG